MIRCRLELLPGGIDDEPELLGVIVITNDLLGSLESRGRRGNYKWTLKKKMKNRVAGSGKIMNYPRLSYHPWELVRLILNDAKTGGVL